MTVARSVEAPDLDRPAGRTTRRRRQARPEWAGRQVITVAALPGRGCYVRHLAHPEGIDGIHRPTVPAPGSNGHGPALFDGRWLGAHLHRMDLVHVHGLPLGQDVRSTIAAVDAVRAAGKPLVFTGYHLSDPTGQDAAGYAARLDVLVPAADAVITLTDTAAAEMERRWGVRANLLPHPHAVDFVRMRRPRPADRRAGLLVGTHLGSLQGDYDPVAFTRVLAEAVGQVPGALLMVSVHDQVLDAQSSSFAPVAIRQIERAVTAAGGVLRSRRPFTDSQLWDHLVSLGASVLPAVCGSHSVWPEACYDLGTPIVLPERTHAARQRPCRTYDWTPDGPDAGSLAAALASAATGDHPRAAPSERWSERVAVGESLRELYERLLGMRR